MKRFTITATADVTADAKGQEWLNSLNNILDTCASIMNEYDDADHVIHCAMDIADEVQSLFTELSDIEVTVTHTEMTDAEVIAYYVEENSRLHKELSDLHQSHAAEIKELKIAAQVVLASTKL